MRPSDRDVDDGRPLSLSLPGAPQSVSAAREFVRGVLFLAGIGLAVIDDALLLISELATNAVIHADSDFEVVVESGPEWIWIGVADRSTEPVAVSRPQADSADGRGLRIVESVAPRWGCESRQGGKVVWFALRPRPTPAPRP
jgi:anti-sigma regulatory factor (Ser/Thr protein kinase)